MTDIVFKRKIYNKLLAWKNERKGKTAALIKGARRVGKSTLAEQFAKQEYKSAIVIDFATATKEVLSLFDDISDLNYLFLRLQVIYHVSLETRNSVIVFDEVQKCPKARQAIKYLVKDGRYDYIETGSLISIRKNVADIIIPSEESHFEMYPMDFEEFLWAIGDQVTNGLLRQFYDMNKPLEAAHRKAMRSLRLYMLVGGMPQAVCEYLDTNNLSKVDSMKRDILELYIEDFRKIDASGRAAQMFLSIPSELNKNTTRYQVGSVLSDSGRKNLDEVLVDMKESMVVNFAYHANDPSVGLALHCDMNRYKIFTADTGLFVTLAFWDKDFTENTIYEKLLGDTLEADLGYIYENLVAQMLTSAGHRLFYHTFSKEKGSGFYEVDFLLSHGKKIQPIEVKSSGYKKHASLDVFCSKFSNRIDRRYMLYTKDVRQDGETQLLPVYFTQFL